MDRRTFLKTVGQTVAATAFVRFNLPETKENTEIRAKCLNPRTYEGNLYVNSMTLELLRPPKDAPDNRWTLVLADGSAFVWVSEKWKYITKIANPPPAPTIYWEF